MGEVPEECGVCNGLSIRRDTVMFLRAEVDELTPKTFQYRLDELKVLILRPVVYQHLTPPPQHTH